MTNNTRSGARTGPQALSTAISAVLTLSASAASAQEQAPEVTGLGEVIVTATKRAVRLQDVSESIAAFDANAIEMRGLKQIDDIVKYIPGMSLSQREPGGTTIVFRGVASSGIQFGAVSSSALYLDEQPITQSGRSPDPRFIDIERVEALRGPQGTLYGSSSQSGTLRVITAKPDPTGFDAWTEAEVSSVSDGDTGYDVSAMLNLPLAEDRISLRVVGFAAEDAGFIDNVLTQSKGQTFDNADVVEEDVNSVSTVGGRAALRFDISENVDLTLTGIYQDVSADGHGDVTPASDAYPDVGDLQQVRFSEESLDDAWYQLGLTLNAATPIGDLVLSASYFDRDFHYEADATDYEWNFNCPKYDVDYNANPPPPFCQPNYVIYDFGGDPRGFAQNDEQTEITTFEARFQSNNDAESRWSWLVGAFYSKETGHTQFDSFVNGYADTAAFEYYAGLQYAYYGGTLAPTDQWWIGVYDTDLEQRAVFGEVGFDVTENFTITAGGRWFEYDRKFRLHQESPVGFDGFSLTDALADTDDSGSVAKLNLTYRIDDDRMVYATYSEGFRNGGSNPVRPNSILPREFSSDELQNYEIGAKTEWLDNRMRFNISVYSMQWDDFAVQIEDPQPGVFQLGYVNLPSAEIKGFESEFFLAIDDAWQLDASLGYNDGEVSEATELILDPGFPGIPVTDGARLPLTPDWTATLGIEYRARGRLLDAQPFARIDLAYVGESVNNLEGIESVVAAGGVQIQEAYDTGDLRVGLEGERWSAAIFVDNFWDERANLFLSNRWAEQRQSINRPRTFGLQFRYDW
jgi:outer membrane receptor protein involved in Fe transport